MSRGWLHYFFCGLSGHILNEETEGAGEEQESHRFIDIVVSHHSPDRRCQCSLHLHLVTALMRRGQDFMQLVQPRLDPEPRL